MGMKYLSDVDTGGGTGDNISVENVKVDSIEIKYGVQESWQTSADDISLHMKLDIGKGFFPDFYIGGQFKVDDVSGNVIGWRTAYKIKLFLDALGIKVMLDKNSGVQGNQLPDGIEGGIVGQTFKRLSYKSTKTKQDGSNRWRDWQQVAAADSNPEDLKTAFKDAVQNNYVKDYLSNEEGMGSFDVQEFDEVKDIPVQLRTPTCEEIILLWLKERIESGELTVASHELESELVNYGKLYYDKIHNPSTYSRAWRKIRQEEKYVKVDIDQIKEITDNKMETTWKIVTE